MEQYDKLEKIPGKKLAIGNFYGNSNNSIILSEIEFYTEPNIGPWGFITVNGI